MSDGPDQESVNTAPSPEITPALFAKWRDARRGAVPAERLTNPVWDWLIRTELWPYSAATYFGQESLLPASPRWCFSRYGMSQTELPDGRTIFVAGEHEDHYDPDFFIYNDVIVRNPDGTWEVFGYPVSELPPTDFHSATLVEDELFLIGNLGYPHERRRGETAALVLNLRTLRIAPLPTTGDCPGWIYKHQAELSGEAILIRGGEVETPLANLENIDDWRLDLQSLTWQRLTDRQWPRIEFRRHDGSMNQLWQIRSAIQNQSFGERFRESVQKDLAALAAEGIVPDSALLAELYHPPLDHQALPVRDDDRFNVQRIQVREVVVWYVEDLYSVMVKVEGKLPPAELNLLAQDLQQKLTRLENQPYVFKFW